MQHESEQLKIPAADVRYTRRQIREQFGWSATHLWHHLTRLCDWEFVLAQGGGRGKLVEYQLLLGVAADQPPAAICGLSGPEPLPEPASETT